MLLHRWHWQLSKYSRFEISASWMKIDANIQLREAIARGGNEDVSGNLWA